MGFLTPLLTAQAICSHPSSSASLNQLCTPPQGKQLPCLGFALGYRTGVVPVLRGLPLPLPSYPGGWFYFMSPCTPWLQPVGTALYLARAGPVRLSIPVCGIGTQFSIELCPERELRSSQCIPLWWSASAPYKHEDHLGALKPGSMSDFLSLLVPWSLHQENGEGRDQGLAPWPAGVPGAPCQSRLRVRGVRLGACTASTSQLALASPESH